MLTLMELGRTAVSPSQLIFLRNAGAQDVRLNTYARTILYLVSGERFAVTASMADGSLQPRSRSDQSDRRISCHPNPVQQSGVFLTISESLLTNYGFTLADMQGNRLAVGEVVSNQQHKIDTSKLPAGIYILTVSDNEDRVIHHDRIVVTK